MKHYLVRTLLYGVGAGIFIFLSLLGLFSNPVNYFFFSIYSILFLLSSIIFFITELRPHTNSETPEEMSQRSDKILLFMLLALSGAGLLFIWTTITLFGPAGANGAVMGLLACCPIDFIYISIALVLLRELFRRRSTKVSSVESSTGDDQQSS